MLIENRMWLFGNCAIYIKVLVKEKGDESAGVQLAGVHGAAGQTRRVEIAGSKTLGSKSPGPKRRGRTVMEPAIYGVWSILSGS